MLAELIKGKDTELKKKITAKKDNILKTMQKEEMEKFNLKRGKRKYRRDNPFRDDISLKTKHGQLLEADTLFKLGQIDLVPSMASPPSIAAMIKRPKTNPLQPMQWANL